MAQYMYEPLSAQDHSFLVMGFNADPKLVPDLEVFVAAVRSSQARVLALARPEPAGEPTAAPHEATRNRARANVEPAPSC